MGNTGTIYVRDASGNVMSVYESQSAPMPVQKETHLYGSSRLGLQGSLTLAPASTVLSGGYGTGYLSTFTRGEKIFELTNHLGNVLATVNDRKLPIDDNADGIIDFYEADLLGASDYYPGGMQMPGRKYSLATGYRYGFNGKEKDNEMSGEANAYDFGERIYNPRIVTWLSTDPLQKKYPAFSPYVAFGNNPIILKDPDGRDIVYFNMQGQEVLRIQSKTKFETYVEVVKTKTAIHNEYSFGSFMTHTGSSTSTVPAPIPFVGEFQKVPMPDIITEKLTKNKDKDGNWIIEKGLDDKKYQQYDYQIAASTFLFNKSKNDGAQFVTDGGMKIPTAITSKVADVTPTEVKELMMQETHCGTDPSMNGTKDIMQVNNGARNFQDFKPYKANYGLSKGTVPGPLLSVTAGLKDFLTKGFHGSKVGTDKSGNITSITFQGWLQAGYNYNGGGVPNYLQSLQHMESTKRAPTPNDY